MEETIIFITPFLKFSLVYFMLCLLNGILYESSYGIKIGYLKKLYENKVNPIYQLKYCKNMGAYVVKKYTLCWNKVYYSHENIYFLIPFLMMFFKYGYIEENGGYKYGSKADYKNFEHLIGERDILEKDLEKFYESKKLEAFKNYNK